MRALHPVGRFLRAHAGAAADLLWPPVCPHCANRARRPREHFCEACWSSLRPLAADEGAWSVVVPDGEPLAARAAFVVDSLFLDMLATSKYRLFRRVGLRLASESARRLQGAVPPGVLVPVPLRGDRRRARGFNQTEDFARTLGAAEGRRVATSWLVRRRGGPPLAGLPRERRAAAVRAAFRATDRFPGRIAGPLVLVDDVVTTGSTGGACAAALREAGAEGVSLIAMGRAFATRADVAAADLSLLGRL